MFEAGDAGSEPALYSASGSRWTESGSLVDGEVLLDEGSSIVRVMLPKSDGSLLRLNDGGPLVLRDYFGSSGDGADLTAWIQTAQGAVSFAASDVGSVGSSYVNFNVPQAARSTLSGIASGDRFILALTRPEPEPEPTATPEPPQKPSRGVEVDDEEQSVGKRQQEADPPQEADTCAPEIESMGGSASNGSVQWKWKSVAPPAPAPGVDGCENRWVDFRVSYSDDYGATFTGAEVVRGYIHNTDSVTYTIGGKEFNRNEEYHSGSAPELSIISKLRVEVGCAAAGANCAHSLDSTPGSFKPYYRSYFTGRENGANTEALLAPANYCTDCRGNASVIGWLDIGEDPPHTYRVHMTAGKTYIFDEHYRKWAMTSGEWRGAEHYYLPDEFRISLFTKNSAGELVAVTDFQDQPENGWQALFRDPDFQIFPYELTWDIEDWNTYFQVVTQLKPLLDNAHLFPSGSQYRTMCELALSEGTGLNVCGHGLDVTKDKGRQLRTASFTPTQSGVYYLQVTRVFDEAPVWGPDTGGSQEATRQNQVCCRTGDLSDSLRWYIPLAGYNSHANPEQPWPEVDDIDENDLPTYRPMLNTGLLLGRNGRMAMPYYELSVEVRGPTLKEISITGGASNTEVFGKYRFSPSRYDYLLSLHTTASRALRVGLSTVTVAATAAQSDATVTISPDDADTSTAGHQVSLTSSGTKTVTFTVTRGTDTETYTIKFSRP